MTLTRERVEEIVATLEPLVRADETAANVYIQFDAREDLRYAAEDLAPELLEIARDWLALRAERDEAIARAQFAEEDAASWRAFVDID